MTERFLVIGSNSFTGSHFVRHLLDRGHEGLGVSRSEEPEPLFLAHRWGDDRGFQFHRIDLNHDLERLVDLVNRQGTTHVVNFAGQGMVAQSWERPEDWYRTNVLAQVGLHEHLRRLSTLVSYLHVSTPEVYGSTNGPVNEQAPFAPTTPYAVSRAACDLHLRTFCETHGFPVTWTRASNVYGPGQQLYRIIPRAALGCRLGRTLPLHGGGTSERNFVHVEDVVSATYLVATRGRVGTAYHVAGTEVVSIRDLVERICSLAGVDPEEVIQLADERVGKDQRYELETGRIRSELGWADGVRLEDGLAGTLRWVDENLEVLGALPLDYVHKA